MSQLFAHTISPMLAVAANTATSTDGTKLLGIRLVGFNPEVGKKILFSLILIVALVLVNYGLQGIARLLTSKEKNDRPVFWAKQGISLLITVCLIIGLVSIWFNDPTHAATFGGLVTAGIAFALQKVLTALAGYFVILRGKTFNVGDRIVMGGVRGDVIDLGFLQTRIMEMGQPPPVESAEPAMWVRARQYTGRIVTITNDKVFDTPIYNYTKEFPFIWDEMRLYIGYKSDAERAEQIIMQAAERHTMKMSQLSEEAICEMERRYVMSREEIKPRVFWRITDNWLEMTLRFVTREHGTRIVKDALSRDILRGFDEANIGIASSTYDIVGMPPIRVKLDSDGDHQPFPSDEPRSKRISRETHL